VNTRNQKLFKHFAVSFFIALNIALNIETASKQRLQIALVHASRKLLLRASHFIHGTAQRSGKSNRWAESY
jgi:hypothetical protein